VWPAPQVTNSRSVLELAENGSFETAHPVYTLSFHIEQVQLHCGTPSLAKCDMLDLKCWMSATMTGMHRMPLMVMMCHWSDDMCLERTGTMPNLVRERRH
jgi:hypothetical protein